MALSICLLNFTTFGTGKLKVLVLNRALKASSDLELSGL